MSAGRNGFVYGYQKAKAHGNSPACYHVGCFGEGGEKEIRFGAGKDGLLHISQIAHERVEKVTDYLSEGQIIKVKVMETDEKGRIKLSMKVLLDRPVHNSNEHA